MSPLKTLGMLHLSLPSEEYYFSLEIENCLEKY
jgi:hypothetical protein